MITARELREFGGATLLEVKPGSEKARLTWTKKSPVEWESQRVELPSGGTSIFTIEQLGPSMFFVKLPIGDELAVKIPCRSLKESRERAQLAADTFARPKNT